MLLRRLLNPPLVNTAVRFNGAVNSLISGKERVRKSDFDFSISRFYATQSDDLEEAVGKDKDKVLKVRVNATRLDALLKAGLGISRNKIEKAFYDDRVRVNGIRPKKKSQPAFEGDELDIVRGPSKVNPLFLDVNRVEILEVGEEGEGAEDEEEEDEEEGSKTKVRVVLKRYKNLMIENYDVPWKGNPMGES